MKQNTNQILFMIVFYLTFGVVKIASLVAWILGVKYWFPKKKHSVLYLENFPIENAGYQYRAGKWANILKQNHFQAEVKTLFENKEIFDAYFRENKLIKFFIKTMWIRFFQCLYALKFETVIVRRELLLYNDYGNLFM